MTDEKFKNEMTDYSKLSSGKLMAEYDNLKSQFSELNEAMEAILDEIKLRNIVPMEESLPKAVGKYYRHVGTKRTEYLYITGYCGGKTCDAFVVVPDLGIMHDPRKYMGESCFSDHYSEITKLEFLDKYDKTSDGIRHDVCNTIFDNVI